ncbi:MAG: DUF3071 domain-containing protein [Propionibacteriaceae bacterium]|jgi:hypothetical protein|nr:DUF3071 domain-containing protein [Propionibacteriaceae bacterium]
MDSALSVREIQARIRAGATVSEVAEAAGVPVEQVEPYAGPVIAEREYIAQQAGAQVARRGSETIPHHTLAEVVAQQLATKGIEASKIEWDAWKVDNTKWTIAVRVAGDEPYEAHFTYDVRGRYSMAQDSDAAWLLGLRSPAAAPKSAREAESTADLNDDIAIVRAVQTEAIIPKPRKPRPGPPPPPPEPLVIEPPELDGWYDDEPTELADIPPIELQDFSGELPPFDLDAMTVVPPPEPPAPKKRKRLQFGAKKPPVAGPDAEDVPEPPEPELEPPEPEPEPEMLEPEVLPADVLIPPPPEVTPDAEDFTESELVKLADGSFDLVPSEKSGIDLLYEMLSGMDEDSVQIYKGLLEESARIPPAQPKAPDPEQPPLIADANPPKPKKAKPRASVPTWDEIYFGSPKRK